MVIGAIVGNGPQSNPGAKVVGFPEVFFNGMGLEWSLLPGLLLALNEKTGPSPSSLGEAHSEIDALVDIADNPGEGGLGWECAEDFSVKMVLRSDSRRTSNALFSF